jgi:hypothetical protein
MHEKIHLKFLAVNMVEQLYQPGFRAAAVQCTHYM